MSELRINTIDVTTDEDGRFSLNDLHRAAGGLKKNEPNRFLRMDSVKETAKVLNAQNRGVSAIDRKSGRYGGGTWVSKELVYKYAMWVSADFEVKVIQTFDAVVGKINPPSTMAALNELTAKIESDKGVASFCGKELAKYRTVKRQNEDDFLREVTLAQLTLGFKEATQ